MTEALDDHQDSKADCKCLNVRSNITTNNHQVLPLLCKNPMMMTMMIDSNDKKNAVVSDDHQAVIGGGLYERKSPSYNDSTTTSETSRPVLLLAQARKQQPLRERRNFVLAPLSTFDSKVVHEHVLLECKEKELYFKTKPSRRGNKIEEILSLFERNTQIIENNSQQPTETKDLSERVSCKYIPTNHRNVNQIILFRRDEQQHHGMSSKQHQHHSTTTTPTIHKSSPPPQKPSIQKSFKRKFIELEESCIPHMNNTPSMKRLIVAAPSPIATISSKELPPSCSLPKTASVFAHAKLRKQKAAALKQSSTALSATISTTTPNCTFHDRIA